MARTGNLPEVSHVPQEANFLNSKDDTTNLTDQFSNHTIGSEQLIVGTTATTFQNALKNTALKAITTVEGADIRISTTGTAPTSTVGLICYQGDMIELDGNYEIVNFSAISAGSATLNIEYKD